jgi:ABC-type multidrug transport system fused ATPase/permease subunit
MTEAPPEPQAPKVRRRRRGNESLLFAIVNRQRRAAQALVIAVAATAQCWFFVAIFTRDMVDRVIVAQAQPASPFIIRIVIWAALASITSAVGIYILRRIAAQVEFDLYVWLYTRLESAVPNRLDPTEAGAVMTQTAVDIAAVDRSLDAAPAIVLLLPALLGTLFGVLRASPVLCLIVISPLAVSAWQLRNMRGRIGADALSSDEDWTMPRGRAAVDAVTSAVAYAVQVVVLLLGAHLVTGGRLWPITRPFSPGRLFLMVMASALVLAIVPCVVELLRAWPAAEQAQRRLSQALALGTAPALGGERLPQCTTGMELRQVTIDRGGACRVGTFDLTVGPGETAVVAASNHELVEAVARVTAGMAVPAAGEVTLEGVGVDRLDPAARQAAMRLLTSDPIATGGSLRENLLLGSPNVPADDAIHRSLELVGLSDLAAELGSLDVPVGSEPRLAADVRQRLGLARAVLHSPRVLVMADALSGLATDEADRLLQRVRADLPACAIVLVTASRDSDSPLDGAVTVSLAEAPPSPNSLIEANPTLEPHSPSLPREGPRPSASAAWYRSAKLGLAVALTSLAALAPMAAFGPIADHARSGTARVAHWGLLLLAAGAVFATSRYVANTTTARLGMKLELDIRRRLASNPATAVDHLGRDAPPAVMAGAIRRDFDRVQVWFGGAGLLWLLGVGSTVAAALVVVVVAPWTLPIMSAVVAIIVVLSVMGTSVIRPVRAWSERRLRSLECQFDRDLRISGEIDAAYARQPYTDAFVDICWERRRARNWVAILGSIRWVLVAFVATITPALLLGRASTRELTGHLHVSTALSVGMIAVAGVVSFTLLNAYLPSLSDGARARRALKSGLEVPAPAQPESGARRSQVADVFFDNLSVSPPATGGAENLRGGTDAGQSASR